MNETMAPGALAAVVKHDPVSLPAMATRQATGGWEPRCRFRCCGALTICKSPTRLTPGVLKATDATPRGCLSRGAPLPYSSRPTALLLFGVELPCEAALQMTARRIRRRISPPLRTDRVAARPAPNWLFLAGEISLSGR